MCTRIIEAMSGINLRLKKFDPSKMADDSVSVFIARRRSGKSVLIKDIMSHKKHIPAGIVLSGTEEGNGFYGDFVPSLFIYNDYDREALDRLIERQKRLVAAKKKNIECFLLLDDVMYDAKFLKDQVVRQVFMNGRHWKIMCLLAMQYSLDMPPALRANVDYVFILRENIIANRERLYKSFFGVFPTFEQFCRVMDECTENYEALVLDNTVKSNRIEDVVFWYKAKFPSPKYRLGAPQFWAAHKKNFDPRHGQRKSQDPKTAKRHTPVRVTKAKK